MSIVDFGSGLWAVIGILSALYRRQIKHCGATINGSLLETTLAWMTINIANYNADGDTGGRHGSGVAFIVPHRAYSTTDGHLIVSSANDTLFAKLCAALDHPEWAFDDRFATHAARLKNRAEIDRLIGKRLSTDSRAAWQAKLQAAGVPVAPIQTTAEVVEHAQTRALGIIEKPSDDEIGLVGLPLSFDGKRVPPLHEARDIVRRRSVARNVSQFGMLNISR